MAPSKIDRTQLGMPTLTWVDLMGLTKRWAGGLVTCGKVRIFLQVSLSDICTKTRNITLQHKH